MRVEYSNYDIHFAEVYLILHLFLLRDKNDKLAYQVSNLTSFHSHIFYIHNLQY